MNFSLIFLLIFQNFLNYFRNFLKFSLILKIFLNFYANFILIFKIFIKIFCWLSPNQNPGNASVGPSQNFYPAYAYASTHRSCNRMIKYIVYNGKVEVSLTPVFHSCCVLRAVSCVLHCCVLRAACRVHVWMEQWGFTHSTFRPCCVLRAAWKYELALRQNFMYFRNFKSLCSFENQFSFKMQIRMQIFNK